MKIALVSAHFSPHIGGVEMHVEKLAREHTESGHEVTVITQTPAVTVDDFPFKVLRLPPRVRSAAFPIGTGLAAAMGSGNFDLVHAHNYHTVLFGQAGRLKGLPVVLTPHYHGTSEFLLGKAAHVVWSRANSSTFRRAAAVIAVTRQERDLLAQHFPTLEGRLQVIPNGVDVPHDIPPGVSKAEVVTILGVGRLERHKRFDRLIAALPFLPDAHLTLIGIGPLQGELVALAQKLGVADRVNFRGRTSQAELWAAYLSADTFCSLSELEAFGLTLAEAITAGTPVVASDIPAHAELVSQAGDVPTTLLGSAVSPAGVAAALAESLRLARRESRPRFQSWSQVASNVLATYERVVSNSAPAGSS